MNTQWHYSDRNQQQQGPVDANWLQAAYARGDITASSLVWCEGMAEWQPVSRVASELGIAIPTPPPVQPRKTVAVAPRGGTPVLLIVLIVMGALVVVVGILAAISIPAYQDYTQRAKIGEAINQASPVKIAVHEYVLANESCPSNGDADIGPAADYANAQLLGIRVAPLPDAPEHCEIELQLRDVSGDQQPDSLSMIFRGPGEWTYRSNLPQRMLPVYIRNALEDAQ